MSISAITLARSGSKALPNKNIMKIGNVALSHFSMLAAQNSSAISHLVYSSDSEHYLKLAETFFDEQKFDSFTLDLHLRSHETSNDTAGSWSAVREVVADLNLFNCSNGIVLLSATCPTLCGSDIDFFCNALNPSKSGFSVREVDYPVENTFICSDGFFKKHALTSFLEARQKSSKVYRPDGHIYYRPLSNLDGEFPDDQTQIIDLQKDFYSNIDTKADFKFAKFTIENLS